MSAVRFSLLALAILAGCEGNPLNSPPGAGPSGGSVSTLTTTGTPSAGGSIERHEVKVTKGSDLGNGFAFQDGKIRYNAEGDTFAVDNLAFDGANVYTRDHTPDGPLPAETRAYAGVGVVRDNQTGALVDQFTYRALYGVSATGRSRFAIVRTGAYVPYGFGGFIYSRTGGVTLPKDGFANYTGTYSALRDANGVPSEEGKLSYVTGDMTVNIDFNDFNADESGIRAGAVSGEVRNRRIFDLDGNEITDQVIAAINADHNLDTNPISELPVLVFSVGPGALDSNGEMEGPLTSNVPNRNGTADKFEDGKYYAVISGKNADEIVGVIVVTSKINSVTLRETGGFILTRP